MIRALRRRLVTRAAGVLDVAFTRATDALAGKGPRGLAALSHAARLDALGEIAVAYPTDAPDFFRPARVIQPDRERVAGNPEAVDLRWPSDFATYTPVLAERWESATANATAVVRHLGGARTGGAPRPALILVHGYLGGHFDFERRAFSVPRFEALGFDVVLYTLPFHGLRAEPGRRVPRFPGADPRITLEGFRQAAGELVDLVAYLRASGHPQVGLLGMSLGGFTTSLLATLEPSLAFAVPLIPLACFADWARDHGRLSRLPDEADREHAALLRAYAAISPLQRAPRVTGERMLVLGAEGDRITPLHHAEALSAHFQAPLHTFAGAHMLQLGRGRAFAAFDRMVRDLGLVPERSDQKG